MTRLGYIEVRVTLRTVCILVLMALLLPGCKKAAAPPARQSAQVVVQTVQTQRVLLRTELPGRTAAHTVAEVRPQVGGIIRERLFTEGATVRAGQVLYRIESAPFAAELEQQEAALQSAQAAARLGELLVERYRKLLPDRSISQQDFDNAVAAQAQAVALIRERAAAVNAARINLQWTKVTSPIGGRIGRSLVTAGALVSANQADALATVSQLDPIYVDLTQSSADILRLRQAALSGSVDRSDADTRKVSLVLEDGSAYPLEGKLQFSEVTVDSTTGAVALRAVFDNPDGLLLPGMFVRAQITEGVNENGILVPQQALIRDRQGTSAARVVVDGKVEMRTLTTSRAVGNSWLVTDGLKAGEQLIIEGAQSAGAGTPVTIASPK
jgi:membrane fusion protein (multidrug efflux system)